MVTVSEENFQVTRAQRWSCQGFTSYQRRKTERMQPGDRLLLYVREPRGFGFTATIASPAFKEETRLWRSHRPEETFPYRVRLRPEVILREGEYVEAIELAPRLEYLRRWTPERWPLAFIDELHLLPRLDFDLIEGEMRRLRRRPQAVVQPTEEAAPTSPLATEGGPSTEEGR